MGIVTISIDAELGWGWHDLTSPPTDRIETARNGWVQLAALCEEFEIPATWAIVGHLLLDDCDRHHYDHPAITNWFEREATEWRDRHDLLFADGLVKVLQKGSIDHEIGCHTFSHVPFGAPEIDRTIARAELEKSIAVAAARDISFDSFVFPRNSVGHLDVLAEYDIETYRGPQPTSRLGSGTVLRKVGKLVRGVAPGTAPPIVEPTINEHGLVDIPASLYLFGFEGPARAAIEELYVDPVVLKTRRGVDAAVGTDGVFHVWLHPNNLVTLRDIERVRAIFSYIDQRRRAGDIEVATMGTIGKQVRAGH